MDLWVLVSARGRNYLSTVFPLARNNSEYKIISLLKCFYKNILFISHPKDVVPFSSLWPIEYFLITSDYKTGLNQIISWDGKMIFVSINSTEEKFIIELRYKIDYVVEKKFGRIKSLNNRTIYVFAQLFFSITKLIFKEVFARSR